MEARGGLVIRHVGDHGPGDEASGLSVQAVPRMLAGDGSPVLSDVWRNPSSRWKTRAKAIELVLGGIAAEAGHRTARCRCRSLSHWGETCREVGMAALQAQEQKHRPGQQARVGRDCDIGDVEALEAGNALMREVMEVAERPRHRFCGACRTGEKALG